MSDEVFDKLYQLHLDTTDPEAKRDRTLAALNARLFKNETYTREVHIGMKKVSAHVLLVAYITGTKHAKLPNDKRFYKGIWKILCEMLAHEHANIKPLKLLSDRALNVAAMDPDVLNFNLKTICDKVVTYSIMNDIEEFKNRNRVCAALTFKRNWVTTFYAAQAYDERPVPLAKTMQFVFGAYRLAFLGKPEPYEGYWVEYAGYAWSRVQVMLQKSLVIAEKHRLRTMREDMGLDVKQDDNKRRPLGYLL